MAETIPDMDFDTKYGHLTRPLKEAVACWDIDLKEVMESFIAAQDDDVGSMDPSRMLNFAQAGMLVSSTATNYSRKVEHLYTLVYSTLDTMSKGEGKSLASSALMKRMRKRIVGFQEVENGFELLDSQFQSLSKGIDATEQDCMSTGSHIMRRVPLLLLPREDSGDKSSTAKEGTAVIKQSANGTDWKTSSCWTSDSGCLLLDPGFTIYEDRITRGSISGRNSSSGPLGPGHFPPIAVDNGPPLPDISAPTEPEQSLIPDDLAPPSPDFADLGDATPSSPEHPSSPAVFPLLPSPEARPKRERHGSPASVIPKPPADLFSVLDPYAVANNRNTKPKYGKCYEATPELKSALDIDLGRRVDLFSPDSNLLDDTKGQTRGQIYLASVPGLEHLSAVLTMKVREAKRKAAQAARERRREELMRQNKPVAETSEDEGDSPVHGGGRYSIASGRESIASFQEDLLADRPLTSVEPGQALVLHSGPTREERALQAERQRIAGLEQVLENSKQFYDELMKKKLAEMLGGKHDDSEDYGTTQSGAGSQSIAALVAAAGNAVQDKIPELYASIRKWQDNLEPLLEEQTSRPVFDLDDYLVSIIDKLKSSAEDNDSSATAISDFLKSVGADDEGGDESPRNAGAISSFEELVKGEPKWNVCRLFLSTLILTNNGNVEIFNDSSSATDLQASSSPRERVPATPARPPRTPAAKITPGQAIVPGGGSPLRGSHTYGAGQSFQIKLRNADKNLKFAIQDNAGVVSGVIPILTNKDVAAPEPIGDVPFASESEGEGL